MGSWSALCRQGSHNDKAQQQHAGPVKCLHCQRGNSNQKLPRGASRDPSLDYVTQVCNTVCCPDSSAIKHRCPNSVPQAQQPHACM